MKKLTKVLFAAGVVLALCGAQAHAIAVGSRGGKKSVARMGDSSGFPIGFNDDKPWKVYVSTQSGAVQIVDESGVNPRQGMLYQVCLGTGAVTTWAVAHDSNTITGLGQLTAGTQLTPLFPASATLVQCQQFNAMFTSGLVIETSVALPTGALVYWRELGGYR